MTDNNDAMKGLIDSLAGIRAEQTEKMTGEERVKQDYRTWVVSTAYPALQNIEQALQSDGATTKLRIGRDLEPRIAITALYKDAQVPPFTYMLFLHEKTGGERAFVMKARTRPDAKYGMPGSSASVTKEDPTPFWDENSGDPFNHAPNITEDHIIKDFTKEFSAHRQHPWPKPR